MKKLFAILLAVAMIAALSVTAFAATTAAGSLEGDSSIKVSGKYNAGGTAIDTYKVTISWDDMEFEYTDATEIWDAENHEWDDSVAAAWTVAEGSSNTITLTNHSNKDVVATFNWNAGTNYTGITANWTGLVNNAVTVGNALSGTADTKTVTFTPAGALAEAVNTMTEIGSITVALS